MFGAGFNQTAQVSVGAHNCFEMHWISESELSCRVPPNRDPNNQITDVAVRQGLMHATLHQVLLYYPPVISWFLPVRAPALGGFVLTIDGNGYPWL